MPSSQSDPTDLVPILCRRHVLTALFCAAALGFFPMAVHAQAPADDCKGRTLDRTSDATLEMILQSHPDTKVTLKNTNVAGSLKGLTVLDCTMDYYTVRYEGKVYLIERMGIIQGEFVCPTVAERPRQEEKQGKISAFDKCK